MAYETFILHGGPELDIDGTVRAGKVSVSANAVVREVGGGIVFSDAATVELAADGTWAFDPLPCTDDPGLLPAGHSYTLTFNLHGRPRAPIAGITAPPGTVTLDAGTLATSTAPAAVDAPAATAADLAQVAALVDGKADAADLAALSDVVDANAAAPRILADATSNPVLAAGEPGFATDTGDLRIGDGTSAWSALPDTHRALTVAAGNSTFARRGTLPILALAPIKRALSEAGTRPVAVQVLGDSTGNDTFEWPVLIAEYLGAQHPEWTVQTRLWNDATQGYAAPVTVQTGPSGAQYLTGAAGQLTRRIAPGSVQHITGPMDIRVKMAPDSWTVAAVFLGRELGAGQRSWWCALNSGGYPQFTVSSDGTALVTLTGLAPVPFAAGQTGWLRLVYTPDNGAGSKTLQPYTSTDGVTWTALGALVTSATAITPHNATAAYIDVGGRGGSTGLPGKYYEVEIRDGVNGPNTVPALVGSWAPSPAAGTPMALSGSPVLTLVNGSHPGADIAYLGNVTRLPKLTPNYGQSVVFLSVSHNESARQDADFLTSYDGFVDDVQARFLGIPLVVLTQNPENGGTNQIAHAARRGNLLTYARAKGLDVIDTFKAFVDDPRGLAALMADTIHPNAAGSQLWADQITTEYETVPA